MNLEVSWEDLLTLSFGLPQFHGHGSWLVCEVVLSDCGLTTSQDKHYYIRYVDIYPVTFLIGPYIRLVCG